MIAYNRNSWLIHKKTKWGKKLNNNKTESKPNAGSLKMTNIPEKPGNIN
jgi:hypothetical protein